MVRPVLLLVACVALLAAQPASAQSRQTYVQFDPFTVKAVLYRPDSGDRPDIGVLLIHRVNNYLGHLAATELARRGFLVLTMNSRFDNNEAAVLWEQIALDVKSGVEYLKRQEGVRSVVLFGHSGGAATLSFYQAVAEKGIGYCAAPGKLTVCGKELSSLPRADALILVDASLGNPVGLLRSLNPSVVTEGDPKALDPALDPFSQANGFNPSGPPSYSAEFRQKYYEAQAARMNRLIASASQQAAQLIAGGGPFPDDNVFLIVRAQGARLADADPIAETATVKPRKLLRNNGSIVTELVRSVRPPGRPNPAANAYFEGGARLLTLKSFLTANAIRSTHSMTGIDWCSSNNSTPCALGQIGVPLLVSAMGGNTGLRDNEWLFENAASRDKDFFVLEGATHNMEPCVECEPRKGAYNNVIKNFFNYVRDWIERPFLALSGPRLRFPRDLHARGHWPARPFDDRGLPRRWRRELSQPAAHLPGDVRSGGPERSRSAPPAAAARALPWPPSRRRLQGRRQWRPWLVGSRALQARRLPLRGDQYSAHHPATASAGHRLRDRAAPTSRDLSAHASRTGGRGRQSVQDARRLRQGRDGPTGNDFDWRVRLADSATYGDLAPQSADWREDHLRTVFRISPCDHGFPRRAHGRELRVFRRFDPVP